jgi:hypothetical protein
MPHEAMEEVALKSTGYVDLRKLAAWQCHRNGQKPANRAHKKGTRPRPACVEGGD